MLGCQWPSHSCPDHRMSRQFYSAPSRCFGRRQRSGERDRMFPQSKWRGRGIGRRGELRGAGAPFVLQTSAKRAPNVAGRWLKMASWGAKVLSTIGFHFPAANEWFSLKAKPVYLVGLLMRVSIRVVFWQSRWTLTRVTSHNLQNVINAKVYRS